MTAAHVCTCPSDSLGRFWRVRFVDRPGDWHGACGGLRVADRHPRPLVARPR